MLAGKGELVARRGDGDDPRTHELGDLDGGDTRSSRGAEDRHGLTRLEGGAVLQAVQRRAVGDGNAGGHLIAYAVRDGNDVLRLGDDLLAAAIAADEGDDPLPQREVGDALRRQPSMVPAISAPGENGSGGDHLILVAQQERVEEVEADRRHFDQDIAGARGAARPPPRGEVPEVRQIR